MDSYPDSFQVKDIDLVFKSIFHQYTCLFRIVIKFNIAFQTNNWQNLSDFPLKYHYTLLFTWFQWFLNKKPILFQLKHSQSIRLPPHPCFTLGMVFRRFIGLFFSLCSLHQIQTKQSPQFIKSEFQKLLSLSK